MRPNSIHTCCVNIIDILQSILIYGHLICFSFSKLVKDWLNDGVILEVERLLERTGGQTEADDGGQQQVVQQSVASELSYDSVRVSAVVEME